MVAHDKRNNTEILWYIVKTRPLQELMFKRILQSHVSEEGNIVDFYCPIHTTVNGFYTINGNSNEQQGKHGDGRRKYRPLFSGQVFVKGTERALADLLETYYPQGSILYSPVHSDTGKAAPLTIPADQMERLKVFNESFPEDPLLLQHPFDDYAFNPKTGEGNEAVVVLDGPLKGRVGYLVRMGKGRSKGLAFEQKNPFGHGNLTIGITDISNFHVSRLHNAERDNASMATRLPRAVDLLVGLVQGAGFGDECVLKKVHWMVDRLVANASFKELGKSLTDEGQRCQRAGRDDEARQDVRLAASLRGMQAEEMKLVLNLVRYEGKFPGYVRENYRKLILRPFLTPTSGIKPAEGKDYALLQHNGFTEIILPVSFPEKVFLPKEKRVEEQTVSYYAHIGLRPTRTGLVLFANWDGFLSKFYLTGGTARQWLVSKDQADELKLDKDGNVVGRKANHETGEVIKKTWNSFYNFVPPLYEVLSGHSAVKAVQGLTIDSQTLNVLAIELSLSAPQQPGIAPQLPSTLRQPVATLLASPAVRTALGSLIRTSLSICTTLSAEMRMKTWRNYLNTVWLHK